MRIFLMIVTLVFNVNAHPRLNDPPLEVNIVGGHTVNIEDYPHQVALLQNKNLFCGGSIVSRNHVVTAGHCVHFATSHILVHAGTSYWSRPGSVHNVDFSITYSDSLQSDIALMHVVEPFVFDKTRQPIPLFNSNKKPQVGALAYVTGWGLDDSGKLSEKLLEVTTRIIDQNTCNKIYEGTAIGQIKPGEICANSNKMGPCRGDSGGPMVVDGHLAGVVSMGIDCSYPKYPGVYVDVGYFSNWIIAKMKE